MQNTRHSQLSFRTFQSSFYVNTLQFSIYDFPATEVKDYISGFKF